MSAVIRPAGPLPARVYWVRRALLVAVVVLLATVLWWAGGRAFGGPDADRSTNSSGGSSGNATPPAATDPGQGHQGGSGKHHRKPHHHKPKAHRPAEPSGDCTPQQVAIAVIVHDVKSGQPNAVGLKLTSVGTPACTLAITPDTLALRITSGPDVVWSSDECPNAVLAREFVVRAHKPVVYTFNWNGRRSTETCAQPGKVADPGGYWAEAALIGADVHRGYFDIT